MYKKLRGDPSEMDFRHHEVVDSSSIGGHIRHQVENVDNNTAKCVPSLLICCNEFVADNLHFVESFEGFPDIIGHQIFRTAQNLGKFHQDNSLLQSALRPFTEGYGSEVLDHLQLSRQHLVLNNNLETLYMFTHLCKLDISCCGIGDQNDPLHHISRLNCLQILILRGNAMTDDGLRKFTAPTRMFKEGLAQLEYLDVSDNLITIRGLKYLVSLPKLDIVNLSNNKIEYYTPLTKHGFHKSSDIQDLCRSVFHIENRGWAAPVIEGWCTLQQQKNATAKKIVTPSFYGTSRKVSSSKSVSTSPSSPTFTHVFVSSKIRPRKISKERGLTIMLGDSPSQLDNIPEPLCQSPKANHQSDPEEFNDLVTLYSGSNSTSPKDMSLFCVLSQWQ